MRPGQLCSVSAVLGFFLLCSAALIAPPVQALLQPLKFDSSNQESRYKMLIAELRCLVCQNQNLADSNAELARDLRLLTYNMILSGRSDSEIIQFMVSRYGDFVLYRPPLKPSTALLWFAPLILLGGGCLVLFRIFRSQNKVSPSDLTSAQRKKLRKLMRDNHSA